MVGDDTSETAGAQNIVERDADDKLSAGAVEHRREMVEGLDVAARVGEAAEGGNPE